MAQDATGTPTALGIPKYNTAADAPSGKGFNAAMDAIDAIITTKGLPTGVTNGPVYWNGSAWVSAKLGEDQLQPNAAIPAGFIMLAARDSVPPGWLICDGAAVSRTTYATLFSAIGTQYGVGDGSTTFNTPNLKGRVPVGKDSGDSTWDVLGETGGAKTHALITAELPAHSHGITDPGHNHVLTEANGTTYLPVGYVGGGSGPVNFTNPQGYNNGFIGISTSTTGISVQNTGSGTAHNNIQPFLVVNYMVKT